MSQFYTSPSDHTYPCTLSQGALLKPQAGLPRVSLGKSKFTERDIKMISAGRWAGMRNCYMSDAAMNPAGSELRRINVRAARQAHWTYINRLREANGQEGYYVAPGMFSDSLSKEPK